MSKSKEDLVKVTLFLRRGDYDFLRAIADQRKISAAKVIRVIIGSAVASIRRNLEEETPSVAIELD